MVGCGLWFMWGLVETVGKRDWGSGEKFHILFTNPGWKFGMITVLFVIFSVFSVKYREIFTNFTKHSDKQGRFPLRKRKFCIMIRVRLNAYPFITHWESIRHLPFT